MTAGSTMPSMAPVKNTPHWSALMIRHHPRAVAAYLRLGAVLARQARWAEARAALAEARAIDPAAPVDPALLAFLERQAGAKTAPVRP